MKGLCPPWVLPPSNKKVYTWPRHNQSWYLHGHISSAKLIAALPPIFLARSGSSFFSSLATSYESLGKHEKSLTRNKRKMVSHRRCYEEKEEFGQCSAPLSRRQGHFYTCDFHNLFMSKKNQSWKGVGSGKNKFNQDLLQKGKRDHRIELGLILNTVGANVNL